MGFDPHRANPSKDDVSLNAIMLDKVEDLKKIVWMDDAKSPTILAKRRKDNISLSNTDLNSFLIDLILRLIR